ncbi:acetylxylan esterase [Paraoerskovia sediminicola]|uniref:Acetylxylan esterase n=1 Tax=Paraoerskovia sediminicola TaxID=1138587 RepID=A0ABN6X9D9_9CELL|nr:acetylxylan esterase [Paraoerskovia sediminicola]BDZ41374.1 acetylxylan esterase [Paraoerskovia sediminicola]
MPQFDLPLDALVDYRPERDEPADFDDFWERTLAEQEAAHPLTYVAERVETGLVAIDTDDVTFTGYGGQPIKAWFHRPAGATEDLGIVVTYIGYGGGRGLSHEHTLLAQAGYAVLVMDNRGQGSAHQLGHTGDVAASGPHAAGFLTQGIDDPETYYYRRLFVDTVRAVDVARSMPGVDPERVLLSGGSQGGAMALASAALCTARGVPLRGVIVDVPFLSHVRRCTEITDALPYAEIVQYLFAHRDLVEQTFRTVSYFDGVNFAPRISAPVLSSVGLRDVVCPPSAVYAVYNHLASVEKEMKVYSYNGHENGGPFQDAEHVRFAHRVLAR